MQTKTIWEYGVYSCKSVTLFSINIQQFNTTYKLLYFKYFFALGRNPDTTNDLKMSMILSWTFLESYWKFDICDIVWYLNFLLVILSIKNLIKSNNNNLNLTALFYRELQITFHIISIKSYACSCERVTQWMQIRNTVKSMIEHHLSRMTISKKYHNRNDLSNQIHVQNISWIYCRY